MEQCSNKIYSSESQIDCRNHVLNLSFLTYLWTIVRRNKPPITNIVPSIFLHHSLFVDFLINMNCDINDSQAQSNPGKHFLFSFLCDSDDDVCYDQPCGNPTHGNLLFSVVLIVIVIDKCIKHGSQHESTCHDG